MIPAGPARRSSCTQCPKAAVRGGHPRVRAGLGHELAGNVAHLIGVAEIVAHELLHGEHARRVGSRGFGDADLLGAVEHVARLAGVEVHLVPQAEKEFVGPLEGGQVVATQQAVIAKRSVGSGWPATASASPDQLCDHGLLRRDDLAALQRAYEFLLRLRNDLHFHAGQANDVLNRSEQLRLAELGGYQSEAGVLGVERFMQDYFRHTSQVSHVVSQFIARATSHERLGKVLTILFGHRVEDDCRIGPDRPERHAAGIGPAARQSGRRNASGGPGQLARRADRPGYLGSDPSRGGASAEAGKGDSPIFRRAVFAREPCVRAR